MIWWVIVLLVVYQIVVLLLDLKILFVFEHPEDGTDPASLAAKAAVLFGLQLSWLLLAALPADAFNAIEDGGLAMDVYWMLGYLFMAIYLSLPLPFAIYYYEAESDPRVTKTPAWKKALVYSLATFCVIALVVGVTYAFMSTAKIPHDMLDCDDDDGMPVYNSANLMWHDHFKAARVDTTPHPSTSTSSTSTTETPGAGIDPCDPDGTGIIKVKVDFITYVSAVSAFTGWWFLLVFLGVGFVALPLDLILQFVRRPKPIDLEAYNQQRQVLGEKATALKAIGAGLKKDEMDHRMASGLARFRMGLRLKKNFNKFRQSVYLIENEFKELNMSLKERGENPAISYAKLAAGIMAAIMTTVWLLHILLYLIVRPFVGEWFTGFLNDFLILLAQPGTFILELLFYTFFVLYLLAPALQLFFCFPIHPMVQDETRMSSFMFNVAMVVLASFQIARSWRSGTTQRTRPLLTFSAL
eukprot:Polyplicarium_translucidae@DN3115_c0_g1_i2.p1